MKAAQAIRRRGRPSTGLRRPRGEAARQPGVTADCRGDSRRIRAACPPMDGPACRRDGGAMGRYREKLCFGFYLPLALPSLPESPRFSREIGIQNVNSTLATAILDDRGAVLLLADGLCGGFPIGALGAVGTYTALSGVVRPLHRRILALLFPGASAGRCEQSRPHRQIQYGADHPAGIPVFRGARLLPPDHRHTGHRNWNPSDDFKTGGGKKPAGQQAVAALCRALRCVCQPDLHIWKNRRGTGGIQSGHSDTDQGWFWSWHG